MADPRPLHWRQCCCNNSGKELTEGLVAGRSMMHAHEAHCPFNGRSETGGGGRRRGREDQVVAAFEQVCRRLDRIEQALGIARAESDVVEGGHVDG